MLNYISDLGNNVPYPTEKGTPYEATLVLSIPGESAQCIFFDTEDD